MTWTYSGNPSASSLDEVRFLVQDTVSTAALLSDEEINYLLVALPPRQAAVSACRTIARKFARQPGSRSIGDVSISYGELSDRYSKLAEELAKESTSLGVIVPTPHLSGADDTPHFVDDDFQWFNHSSSSAEQAPDLTER